MENGRVTLHNHHCTALSTRQDKQNTAASTIIFHVWLTQPVTSLRVLISLLQSGFAPLRETKR